MLSRSERSQYLGTEGSVNKEWNHRCSHRFWRGDSDCSGTAIGDLSNPNPNEEESVEGAHVSVFREGAVL